MDLYSEISYTAYFYYVPKICKKNMLQGKYDGKRIQITDQLAVSYELPLRFAACDLLRSYKPYLYDRQQICIVVRHLQNYQWYY